MQTYQGTEKISCKALESFEINDKQAHAGHIYKITYKYARILCNGGLITYQITPKFWFKDNE